LIWIRLSPPPAALIGGGAIASNFPTAVLDLRRPPGQRGRLEGDAQDLGLGHHGPGRARGHHRQECFGRRRTGVTKGLGIYGTDYMKRAVVAAFGWPANREKDAVYPYTEVDSAGQKLTGANKYTLIFAKDQTPPVDGFWSITMYEIDQGWWFVPNPLNKFTVSPRNNPKYDADGSLTLYFQNESPGADKEANWLPAPKGDFLPMLRMYWPKETPPSILNSTWKPPAVQREQGAGARALQ
jgi:hypothetical protein